jgi:hypothetical protein
MFDFTAKDISEAFQVSMPKARAIMKVCRLWLNSSWSDRQDYEQWLDKACGTFGIEGVLEDPIAFPDCTEQIDFYYLNTGDTYNTTLLFLDPKYGPCEILLTSWGDYMEQWDRDRYDYLESPRPAICPDCNQHCFYEDQSASRRLEALKGELQCPNCLNQLHF